MELFEPETELEPNPIKKRKIASSEEAKDDVLDPNIWGQLPIELVLYILRWRTALTIGEAEKRMKRAIAAWAGVAHELRNVISSALMGTVPYHRNYGALPVFRRWRFHWIRQQTQDEWLFLTSSRGELCSALHHRVPITTLSSVSTVNEATTVITYAQRRKYGLRCLCCGYMTYMPVSKAYKKSVSLNGFICKFCTTNACARRGLFGIHGLLPFPERH
jgi:hypothetical protein